MFCIYIFSLLSRNLPPYKAGIKQFFLNGCSFGCTFHHNLLLKPPLYTHTHMQTTHTTPIKSKPAAYCGCPDSVRATSVSQTASSQSSQSAGWSVVKEVTQAAGSSVSLPHVADTKTYGLTPYLALALTAFFRRQTVTSIPPANKTIICVWVFWFRTSHCKVYWYM